MSTLIAIPFFDPRIEINVHTARYREHIRHISIEDFAECQPVALYQIEETGEYLAKRKDGAFIEGEEI